MGLIMYGGTPYGGVRKSSSGSSAALLDSFLDGSYPSTEFNNEYVTTVSDYTFYNSTFTSISLPNALYVNACAFYNSTELAHVFLPNVKTIRGTDAFYNCSKLTSISLPNLTVIEGTSCFCECSSLSSICLPELVEIPSSMFSFSTNLELVDFCKASEFNIAARYVFNQTASNLKLILRNSALCTLANPNDTFYGSAFASTGSGGTLYVPQSLVSAYQNDTKWKQVMNFNANNQILPIEGSPYENTNT